MARKFNTKDKLASGQVRSSAGSVWCNGKRLPKATGGSLSSALSGLI